MTIQKILLVLAAMIASPVTNALSDTIMTLGSSEISTESLSANSYRLTLKSYQSRTVTAGQEELMPKAIELCAPGNPNFGRYSFNMDEPLSGKKDKPAVLVLHQDVECNLASSTVPSPVAQSGTAPRMATPEQVRRVEQQTRLYFEARDGGHYSDAYKYMAASLKQTMSFETWKGKTQVFNSKAGAVAQRKIAKITWYYNPPQAEPGLYAAVDFTSKFADVDLHCGFLAWRELQNGKFVLVREEENYLDKQTQMKLNIFDLEKVRQQFRCK